MKKIAPHFWFMTIATSDGRGPQLSNYRGVMTPKPGSTRADLFDEIRAQIHREDPQSQGGVVIAFDVQPNHL